MARNRERPGFLVRGFIEMPEGKRTTAARREELEDVMTDAFGIGRDKVEGATFGLEVDRLYIEDNRMTREKGPRLLFEED